MPLLIINQCRPAKAKEMFQMWLENCESYKSVLQLQPWDVTDIGYWILGIGCYWISSPSFPSFSFSCSLYLLLILFPAFPGLGCPHQWVYPFPQSATNMGVARISGQPQSLHSEQLQKQAILLSEMMLPHLIHLKETLYGKEHSH